MAGKEEQPEYRTANLELCGLPQVSPAE